jgi:hypothetical protein
MASVIADCYPASLEKRNAFFNRSHRPHLHLTVVESDDASAKLPVKRQESCRANGLDMGQVCP